MARRFCWQLSLIFLSPLGAAVFLLACSSEDELTLSNPGGDSSAAGRGGSGGTGGGGETTSSGGGSGGSVAGIPTFEVPKAGLGPEDLGLLVNTSDPQSVAVAAYYQEKRQIPAANVITVSFPADGKSEMSAAAFAAVKAKIDAAPAAVQAVAVSWTAPSTVECMSLTTAIAFGFDTKWCNTSGKTCGETAVSSYYNSPTKSPFKTFAVRPAMMLGGRTIDAVKQLIDRGIAATGTMPTGDGYLVTTTDTARSPRYRDFETTVNAWSRNQGLKLDYIDNRNGSNKNYIENKDKVLFYFTGLDQVPEIASNKYLPGAVADHLTSLGGQLPDSGQMSSLRWLEAGATGSYGTVFESCNYLEKFPQASVLIDHYFRGNTLTEAYWKSVHWPGEGVFIGEPLASPWGQPKVTYEAGTLTVVLTSLIPGKNYRIEAADSPDGSFIPVQTGIKIAVPAFTTLTVKEALAQRYRLTEER